MAERPDEVHQPTDLLLTPKQIVAIYDAGRERGRDEATAYEWGQHAQGDRLDNLRDALVWRDDLTGDEARAAWWTSFKEATGE